MNQICTLTINLRPKLAQSFSSFFHIKIRNLCGLRTNEFFHINLINLMSSGVRKPFDMLREIIETDL